jgi:hypothetical protein
VVAPTKPTCHHCGYVFPITYAPIAKKFAIMSGISILLAVGAFYGVSSLGKLRASNPQPAPDVNAGKPITLSAESLYNAYHFNQSAADTNYKGRTIQVVGAVSETGGDDLTGRYLVVGGHGLSDGVQCFFAASEGSRLTNATVGTILTVKGRVDGQAKSVVLRDCRLP